MLKLDLVYKQPFYFYFIEIFNPLPLCLFRPIPHAYFILPNVPTPMLIRFSPFIWNPRVPVRINPFIYFIDLRNIH